MKNTLSLIVSAVLCCSSLFLNAQNPNLQSKQVLPTTLLNNKTFTSTNSTDIEKITTTLPPKAGDYTLEVKGKITLAEGRGLDIETRDADGAGFRTSLNAESFNWTTSLNEMKAITRSNNSRTEQTLRFAVKDGVVHIYHNGYYIATENLGVVKDIVNGVEVDASQYGPNIMSEYVPATWDETKPTPASLGWKVYQNGNEVTMPDNVRFEKSPDAFNMKTTEGTSYQGGFLFLRWDGDGSKGNSYVIPVTLEANSVYDFSMKCAYWSNFNSGGVVNTRSVVAQIGTDATGLNPYSSKAFTPVANETMEPGSFQFRSKEAGTYYISFVGAWGLFGVTDFSVRKISAEPHFIFGKNYPDGAVNMEISAATFDDSGAFAPVDKSDASTTVILYNRGTVEAASYFGSNIRVEGKTELHLTSESIPFINSKVNLVGDNAWLYFDNIKPSVVISDWLQYVKINGNSFNKNNDRVAIYGSGAVVIPNGKKSGLTVYTEKNFGGESNSYNINTYYNELGEFDNKIQSFKLRKGFAATLANNPNGTGFSRFFIASDEDIEFAEMPEGMEGFVSYIRVFKWEWAPKKGWAGNPSEKLNVAISYDWDASNDTENEDRMYVPMRHNLGWQSFEVIDAHENVSHLLGYNEPDRPDQADMTVEAAITQWPEYFKSGLRLGSPAPSSTPKTWLTDFMTICDELNYRVDFMVTHAYQYQPTNWWDWYVSAVSIGNRPVWITEWNNGANWTTEGWPTTSGPKRDAYGNIILDDTGNEITVNKPLSPENAAYSKAKMQQILPHFENIDKLEHHFLYNWVQDARSMILDDNLTPAGEYFANFKSKIGFQKKNEYIHTWKIAPPWIVSEISEDYKSFNLQWYDHNGETGKNYVLERKLNDGNFEVLKTYVANTDYNYGDTIQYTELISFDKATYRIRATSYKDTQSNYSREAVFTRDQQANPPVLSGEAVASTILKLQWTQAANARSYRLERSTAADGEYQIIEDYFEGTELTDRELTENTNYYYRIYSLNTAGVSAASAPFQLKTKQLVTPSLATGLRAASGDKAVTLTWDFVYDAMYEILRSDSENGEYTVIATGVEVLDNDARYKDVDGINYAQTYYYKVRPYNAAGVGTESAPASATPQVGQFLNLTFKEGAGNIVYDNWGGYHAEFKDGPTWNTESGRNGESSVFLTTTDKSYLQLPQGVVSELTETFTIASWLYLPENAGNNTRMFDFGSGTGVFMVFIPKYSAGMARYKLTYPAEDGTQLAFQPTFAYNFPLGEWAHVAFTIQPHPMGGLFFSVYLNGERVAFDRDLDVLTPAKMGFTEANYLGRSQWPADPYCAHGYDDFRIYNQTLSAANIRKLYQGEQLELQPPVSIDEVTFPDEIIVTVAPNPVAANEPVELHIANCDVMPKDIKLGIYNMLGSLIAERTMNSFDATFTAPAVSGTYIVKVSSGTFSKSVKLIVK